MCPNRRAAAEELVAQHAYSSIAFEGTVQADDAERELFGAGTEDAAASSLCTLHSAFCTFRPRYCTIPFVSRMNAVSRLTSSSFSIVR
jgi:hypothetical protein